MLRRRRCSLTAVCWGVLAALVLLVAACSGGSDGGTAEGSESSDGSGRSSGSDGARATAEDDGAPGSEAGDSTTSGPEPVDGGRLRIGLGGPLVVDPTAASVASPGEMMVLDLLHDGLVRLDSDGVPRGAIARSWTADQARTTWQFSLDPEATFSDGRPITAADVVASLERIAAGGDASLAALRLEPISGFRAFVDGTAEHLAGLSAPDPATVKIALDAPLSVLPAVLASPVYGVVDTTALAAGVPVGLGQVPLSGAWSVAGADDASVVLERRGDAGHLDEVELRSYDGAVAAYDAFERGDVDHAPVPPERIGAALAAQGDDHFAPFQAELIFGLNLRSPKFANESFRQAILAAIDREAVVGSVYSDLAQPLATLIPAGVATHDPERCAACVHDPDRARQLVQQAFPDGAVPTVNVDFDESPAQRAVAEIVAADLAEVGIPTNLRPFPIGEYKSFVVSGGAELFSFGWIGVYASPDAYLAPLFATGAPDNLTGFGSVDVDALLTTARATGDRSAALQHWAEAEAAILRSGAIVPIAQFRTQVVVADQVQGLHHAVDGTVDWSQVWLSDEG